MTSPIIIKNSIIPKLLSWVIDIKAITLFPFIIFEGEADEQTLNHEKIHIKQQAELLVLPFYILYVGFWAWGKLKGKDNSMAYRDIPFEKEAYANDSDWVYLLNRKKYAWIKYI